MLLERLSKLLTIKSIVTLFATGVFCYLAIKGSINAESFLMIFSTIIAFYFGTQVEKNQNL